MKKGLAVVGVGVVLLAVVAYFMVSPPKLLSVLDWAAGGGRGTERVASGVAFGTHGQRLDVWAPVAPAAKGARRPVVIFWHGGGWVKGDRDAYAFAGRAFAARGFVVVIPDYRKVPGVRFPAFLQDGAEAVRWTRDHIAQFGGDPSRVALAGHSAGAYTAVMLALDTQWLKAVGADPGIVKAAVGLSGPYDFYPFDKKRSIDAMSYWPRPLETQPIRFARSDAPPLLLITSSGDTQVRPKNAVNLAARLESLGAPVVMKNYQGLTHEDVVMALAKPFRGKAPVFDDSLAFLAANDGR